MMEIDDIKDEAIKSYVKLYDEYGIRPNGWIMSSDVIYTLSSMLHQGNIIIEACGTIQFMGITVHLVKGTKVIKAIIQDE